MSTNVKTELKTPLSTDFYLLLCVFVLPDWSLQACESVAFVYSIVIKTI